MNEQVKGTLAFSVLLLIFMSWQLIKALFFIAIAAMIGYFMILPTSMVFVVPFFSVDILFSQEWFAFALMFIGYATIMFMLVKKIIKIITLKD